MNSNEGGLFRAIIVKDGKIIGKGNKKVISKCDPSADAEIVVIR